jgi:hypothetical protein
MVYQQATQPPQQPTGSVRITAQVRRQVLREHYESEQRRQQAIVASECNDLKVLRANHLPAAVAEHRAANAVAVLQYIGTNLTAYSDNRDFRGVAR